jgi:hypothetical protein
MKPPVPIQYITKPPKPAGDLGKGLKPADTVSGKPPRGGMVSKPDSAVKDDGKGAGKGGIIEKGLGKAAAAFRATDKGAGKPRDVGKSSSARKLSERPASKERPRQKTMSMEKLVSDLPGPQAKRSAKPSKDDKAKKDRADVDKRQQEKEKTRRDDKKDLTETEKLKEVNIKERKAGKGKAKEDSSFKPTQKEAVDKTSAPLASSTLKEAPESRRSSMGIGRGPTVAQTIKTAKRKAKKNNSEPDLTHKQADIEKTRGEMTVIKAVQEDKAKIQDQDVNFFAIEECGQEMLKSGLEQAKPEEVPVEGKHLLVKASSEGNVRKDEKKIAREKKEDKKLSKNEKKEEERLAKEDKKMAKEDKKIAKEAQEKLAKDKERLQKEEKKAKDKLLEEQKRK